MSGDLRRYAAANARVRVQLADLLGRPGLEALCTYPSAPAVVQALRRTAYGGALADAAGAGDRLPQRLAAVGQALLRVLAGPERAFVRGYLLRLEVDTLKILIRGVHRRQAWEQLAPHVVALYGVATIDPHALAGARNLGDLVARLSGTAYAPVLRSALRHLDAAGPFALEVALELDYYERLWDAAGTLRAADARVARRLLGVLFDLLNLAWIARYRDALRLSAEEVLNYTVSRGRWLTLSVRRALAEAAHGSWDDALAGTPYAQLRAAPGAALPGGIRWRVLALEAQRCFTGYPFHIGVPLGCVMAYEIELRDLRILLAAKRLGMPGAAITERLASVHP